MGLMDIILNGRKKKLDLLMHVYGSIYLARNYSGDVIDKSVGYV